MTVDDRHRTVPPPWSYDHAWDAPPAPAGTPPTGLTGAPPAPAPRPRRGLSTLLVLALVAGGSAAGGATWATSRTGAVASPVVGAGDTAPTEQLARVAAAVSPSVVSIAVSGRSGSGEGSGVVIRSDGVVATNAHVVDGATSITVRFSDGSTRPARLLGSDRSSDLAVVQATGASGLSPITFGDVDSLHVGDAVLALGSPLGLEGSVSSGIVSALHRTLATESAALGDVIQTDAAINPGNSGGPLVDLEGRLVGITTAIATTSRSSGSIGLGFAIPVDQVKAVTDALVRGEQPQRAVLGVQSGDAVSTSGAPAGAVLRSVTPGSAAADAGLHAGDVVTRVGDITVEDATDLTGAVRSQRPGDEVVVTYRRGGTERTATVTLG
jgi:putative serine protease PepD